MKKHKFVIRNNAVEFIYADSLLPYMQGNTCKVRRASYVEPNESAQWVADMNPVDGPRSQPFATREEALRWEEAWLNENYL